MTNNIMMIYALQKREMSDTGNSKDKLIIAYHFCCPLLVIRW